MRILKFAIALSLLCTQNFAFAGGVGTNQFAGMSLVDDYLRQMAKDPKSKDFSALAQIARQQHLQDVVVAQIERLVPGDFNIFLFALLERYAQHPDERALLASLFTAIRQDIAPELEATQTLKEDGAVGSAWDGTVSNYAFWIAIGASVAANWLLKYHGILEGPQQTAALANSIERDAVNVRAPRFSRMAKQGLIRAGVRTGAIAVGAGSGAAIGYLYYLLENNKTHKLDPAIMLQVLQANLACELSYQALKLDDKFNQDLLSADGLGNNGPTYGKDILSLMTQATELKKEYPQLENLLMRDRIFQEHVNALPPARSWQELRSHLNATDKAVEGQCQAVSMDVLLNSMLIDLAQVPPPPEAPNSDAPKTPNTKKPELTGPPAPPARKPSPVERMLLNQGGKS